MRIALTLALAALSAICAVAAPIAPVYLGSFGGSPTAPRLQFPMGLAVDLSGNVWVADAVSARVLCFTPEGALVSELPSPSPLWTPQGVALLPGGDMAVASATAPRLLHFAADHVNWTDMGETIGCFGVCAAAGGGFRASQPQAGRVLSRPDLGTLTFAGQPNGIAESTDGSVYVVLSDQHRVEVRLGPAHGLAWGSVGSGPGRFSWPSGIAIASDLVFVTDTGNHRVQVFRRDGTYVTQFGTMGSGPGQFQRPGGIAAAPDGSIYVSDPDNHRVTRWGYAPTAASPASWGRIKSLFR